MFKSRVPHALMASAIAAVSKYHIPDRDSGVTIGRHPLVYSTKKAFWQLRPPLPKYQGTYDMKIVLRFIEKLGENRTMILKQLSLKTAFLVVFYLLKVQLVQRLNHNFDVFLTELYLVSRMEWMEQ